MTADIPPRLIAQAIPDLGADQARESWRYVEAWRVLGGGDLDPEKRLGFVPLVDLRHALEQLELDTEALRRVRAWSGRGLLVLHGTTTGTGKTYAAVRWLLDGFDKGQRAAWLACAEWPHDGSSKAGRGAQQAWLDRGRVAHRLVIDDIGAGSTGGKDGARPWTAEPMEGLLMERISAGRPTLLLSNSNAANMQLWLGARVWSRVAMGGGVVEIKSRTDLRKTDDVDPDDRGRSPTWHRHSSIVRALGVVRGDDGLVVGGELEAATRRCERAAMHIEDAEDAQRVRMAPIRYAAELLGLDHKVVRARARRILAHEQAECAKLAKQYDVEVGPDGFTVENAMETVRAMLARDMAVQQAKAAELSKVWVSESGRSLSPSEAGERKRRHSERFGSGTRRPAIHVPAHVADEAVDAARELAMRYGLFVRVGAGELHDVMRKDPDRPKAAPSLVQAGFPSEGQAWLGAAASLREEVEAGA